MASAAGAGRPPPKKRASRLLWSARDRRCAYLDAHAPQQQTRFLDLLDVWATEMDHPERKCEAEILRFGLLPMAA